MMWDYESLIGKAQVYFTRAQEHPRADDVFSIWLLLGLEFLLRAPLARIHPTLLADPRGDAILHAAGFPGKPDGSEPTSIPAHTVITRLGRVLVAFTKERQDDATILIGLRNKELHTGAAALAIDTAVWLPRFSRVVDVVCEHLELDPADLLGQEVVAHGRALVDAEDNRLRHEVQARIAAAKAFFARLQPVEIDARRLTIPRPRSFQDFPKGLSFNQVLDVMAKQSAASSYWVRRVVGNCPACDEQIPFHSQPVRSTNERLEDGEIYHDVIYVVTGLKCPVCTLELSSTAEVRCAGLQQQYTRVEHESLEDRFLSNYEPDGDYGND